ncbi:MAG: hypothetical protein HY270_00520 [Deltaproteobacteria bacterium]|nr:hypothetical protein [Deltaproteobacteria bacterium]
MLRLFVQTMPDLAPTLRHVLGDVIERIVPSYPVMDADTQRTVHADVTRYVASQIAGMPGFLRLPYFLALFGFNWLSVLRNGRPFRSLPVDRQASYLALWNDAPIGPMRDFVKLIRSSALLVYFDHPLVMRQLEAERRLPVPSRDAANG